MHELAIAESVVEMVLARTDERPVRTIRLQVGRLAGVVLTAFEFCFELATAGTPLEGAALEIDEPPGVLHCRGCGEDHARDDLIMLCDCGSADVEVLSGRELQIVSVELFDVAVD